MFKKILMTTFVFLFFFTAKNIFADSVIDNGLNFLRSKQDATGRINSGFSAPSQWSSIAFAANGIDISTIKNPSVSLQDFLISNLPNEPSAATDWETRILAIIATGGDPTNYGGTNYVSHLESFYSNSQIGDECSLNDDIFGLLAEISAGSTSNVQIKQGVLDFLILKQDTNDGGFGYSAPGCAWYSTSSDMTAAAIQALVAAKNNGLTNPNLDNSIDRAKNYLLANQGSDGGFGYYGSSDSDTTGWVLMAFNVLDMKESTAAAQAKDWLLTQQLLDDGGFVAFDYGLNKFISNSTTTAQAIIALSGKSWILKFFDPTSLIPIPTLSITPTATPTNTPTPNPTVTPTPTPLASPEPTAQAGTSVSTPILSPTLYPTLSAVLPSKASATGGVLMKADPTPTETQVLGAQTVEIKQIDDQPKKKSQILSFVFLGLSILSLIIHKGIMYR